MNFKTWEAHFLSGLNVDFLDFGFAGSEAMKKFLKNLSEKTRIANIEWLVNGDEIPQKEEILSAIQREANLSERENVLFVVENYQANGFKFDLSVQTPIDEDQMAIVAVQTATTEILNATSEYLNIEWKKSDKICRSAIITFIYEGEQYKILMRTFKKAGDYRQNLATAEEIEGIIYEGIVHSESDENLILAVDSMASLILKPLENSNITKLIEELKLNKNLVFNDDAEIAVCLNKTFDYIVSKNDISTDELMFLLRCNKDIQPLVEHIDDLIANDELFKKNLIQILTYYSATENGKKMLNSIFDHLELEDITRDFLDVLRKYSVNNFELRKEIEGTEIVVTWDGTNLTSNVERCSRCNGFSPKLFVDPNGHRMCLSCLKRSYNSIDSRVLSYHSGSYANVQPSLGELPSEKSRYGFELEIIRNDNSDHWLKSWQENIMPIIYGDGNIAKLNRDGSLRGDGEELISQPLNKEYILGDKIKTLIQECAKLYHPNYSCGLHIHVDKTALTPEQWAKLLMVVNSQYNNLVEVGIFRPTNGYNDLSQIKDIIQRNKFTNNLESLYQDFLQRSGHYSSVSYSSHTEKTIEFRMFNSTVDYDQFIKVVKFIMLLMDNVDLLYDAVKDNQQHNLCINA